MRRLASRSPPPARAGRRGRDPRPSRRRRRRGGRPGAVGALRGVDPEREVAPAMQDPGVDDALDEIGPGGILRGRWVAAGAMGAQLITAASGWSVSPVSPSNICSLLSGRTRLTMSPGL